MLLCESGARESRIQFEQQRTELLMCALASVANDLVEKTILELILSAAKHFEKSWKSFGGMKAGREQRRFHTFNCGQACHRCLGVSIGMQTEADQIAGQYKIKQLPATVVHDNGKPGPTGENDARLSEFGADNKQLGTG